MTHVNLASGAGGSGQRGPLSQPSLAALGDLKTLPPPHADLTSRSAPRHSTATGMAGVSQELSYTLCGALNSTNNLKSLRIKKHPLLVF